MHMGMYRCILSSWIVVVCLSLMLNKFKKNIDIIIMYINMKQL